MNDFAFNLAHTSNYLGSITYHTQSRKPVFEKALSIRVRLILELAIMTLSYCRVAISDQRRLNEPQNRTSK